jgi:hypothetical protein
MIWRRIQIRRCVEWCRLQCCSSCLLEALCPFFSHNPNLLTHIEDPIGFSDDQIAAIHSGQAVAHRLHSRTLAEISEDLTYSK